MRYEHPIYGWGTWHGAEEALNSLTDMSGEGSELAQARNMLTIEEIANLTMRQKLNLLLLSPVRVEFKRDNERCDFTIKLGNFLSYLAPYEMSFDEANRENKLFFKEFLNLNEQAYLNLKLLDGVEKPNAYPIEALFLKRKDFPIREIIKLTTERYRLLELIGFSSIRYKLDKFAFYGTSRNDAQANDQAVFDDLINFSEYQLRLVGRIPISEIIAIGNVPKTLTEFQIETLRGYSPYYAMYIFLKHACMSIDDFLTLDYEDREVLAFAANLRGSLLSTLQYRPRYIPNRLVLYQWAKMAPYGPQSWKNRVANLSSQWLASLEFVDGKYELKRNEFVVDGLINKTEYQLYVSNILKDIIPNLLKNGEITLQQIFILDERQLLRTLYFAEDIYSRYHPGEGDIVFHPRLSLSKHEFWYLINSTNELREFIKAKGKYHPLSPNKIFKKLHAALIQYTILNIWVKTNGVAADILRHILSFLHEDKILDLSTPYLKLIKDRYNVGQPRFFLNAPIERFELGPDNVDVPGSETKNAI